MPDAIWRRLAAVLTLIYLVLALLTAGIRLMHMHPDEHLVYFFTRNDLGFLVSYLAQQDSHPPLWFSSFWLWRQIAGESEFAGRFYSVLLTALTLSLVYRLGRRWFGTDRFGLYAVALLGVNAFFFTYALEIRPYALIMLLVAASMWFLQRWLGCERWRPALLYSVTVAAMLYVHYFLLVLILLQGACAVVWFARRPSRRLAGQAAGAVSAALLLWLPWLPSALFQVSNARSAEIAGGNARGLAGVGSTTVVTSWTAVASLAEWASNGWPLLYAAALLIGAALLRRRAGWWLALTWALGAPALSLLLNTVVAVYTPRYVVYMVVGLALAVGAGLAALPRRARTLALVVFLLLSLWTLPAHLPDQAPLRDIYARMSALAQPDDAVFFDQADIDTRFVQWQVQHYLSPALYANRVNSVEEAQAYRRVWYAADWFLSRPDAQARFAELERTHPLQLVLGDCGQNRTWCYLVQLMEAPPRRQGQVFGGQLIFHGIDIDTVTREAAAVRLWWSVAQPPALDYSIGLHLLDAHGQLVAQADGPVRDQYAQLEPVQTSQLTPGRFYIDHRRLALPPDLPSGVYQLALVVYQPWDGARLLLADGADVLLLDSLALLPE
ncbi:MAG: glycosyltransferase family 39 protein [Aggregatilineales bacterium]